MQAGLLRDIVAIEKATVTKNPNSGEENLTWVQIWRGRARVEFSSGTQLLENNETWNTITRKVTIRTKPVFSEPLSKLRMVIDSKYYRLLSMDVRVTDMATICIVELINE